MAPRGVYRERNEWGNGQNSVVVDYGTSHFDVTEDKYREDGYQPPFEELPWKPEETQFLAGDSEIIPKGTTLEQLREDILIQFAASFPDLEIVPKRLTVIAGTDEDN